MNRFAALPTILLTFSENLFFRCYTLSCVSVICFGPSYCCLKWLRNCVLLTWVTEELHFQWVLKISIGDSLHCLQPCSPSQRISFFNVILSLVSLSSALVQIIAVVLLSQVVKIRCAAYNLAHLLRESLFSLLYSLLCLCHLLWSKLLLLYCCLKWLR
nr:uncharacterized protein LOC112715456 [Arachis hypogaea]